MCSRVPWTPEIAVPLYLAIATDTGGLRYGPISARTFELCRRVAATGVETAKLSRQIFDSYSLGRISITGALLSGMTLHHGDRAGLLSLDDDLLTRCGATIDDTEGLVNLPLAANEVVAVACSSARRTHVFVSAFGRRARWTCAPWRVAGEAAGTATPPGLRPITGTEAEVRESIVTALGRALTGA